MLAITVLQPHLGQVPLNDWTRIRQKTTKQFVSQRAEPIRMTTCQHRDEIRHRAQSAVEIVPSAPVAQTQAGTDIGTDIGTETCTCEKCCTVHGALIMAPYLVTSDP